MDRTFNGSAAAGFSSDAQARAASPGYQAYRILHLGFIVAPVVAGLDKFFHLLANWDQRGSVRSSTAEPAFLAP